MKIIFVAGIHGVGKTTFCKKKGFKNVYIASELIKKYKSLDGKLTDKIPNNQDILVKAVKEIKQEQIYLDGHFSLLDLDEKIVILPFQLYKILGINEIILLTSKIFKIQERLKKRDGKIYSLDLLEEFQNSEIRQAKLVAQKLDIKLNIIEV